MARGDPVRSREGRSLPVADGGAPGLAVSVAADENLEEIPLDLGERRDGRLEALRGGGWLGLDGARKRGAGAEGGHDRPGRRLEERLQPRSDPALRAIQTATAGSSPPERGEAQPGRFEFAGI